MKRGCLFGGALGAAIFALVIVREFREPPETPSTPPPVSDPYKEFSDRAPNASPAKKQLLVEMAQQAIRLQVEGTASFPQYRGEPDYVIIETEQGKSFEDLHPRYILKVRSDIPRHTWHVVIDYLDPAHPEEPTLIECKIDPILDRVND